MRTMKAMPFKVLDIPLVYDDRLALISDSRGVWPFKRIVVGPAFNRLTPREQQAVVLHEAGHCKLYHLEKRLVMLWLAAFSPRRLIAMCHEQEYAADRFAAAAGYGLDLVSLFNKMREAEQEVSFHPPLASRIERLMRPQGA